jgi:ABC-type transporter MlaC component
MKGMAVFGLGVFLFMQPASVAAGAPGDQVRQSVDKLLAILADPRLKQEDKKMSDARNSRKLSIKDLISRRWPDVL